MTRTPRQLAAENARRAAAGEPTLTPVGYVDGWYHLSAREYNAALRRAYEDGKAAAPSASPEPVRAALERLVLALEAEYFDNIGTVRPEWWTAVRDAQIQADAALAAAPAGLDVERLARALWRQGWSVVPENGPWRKQEGSHPSSWEREMVDMLVAEYARLGKDA